MQCVHLVLSGETTHARLLWYSHRESSFSAALKKSSDYSRKHIQHDMQCVIADNIRGCHLLFDLPVKSIATLTCDNKECHRIEEQKEIRKKQQEHFFLINRKKYLIYRGTSIRYAVMVYQDAVVATFLWILILIMMIQVTVSIQTHVKGAQAHR